MRETRERNAPHRPGTTRRTRAPRHPALPPCRPARPAARRAPRPRRASREPCPHPFFLTWGRTGGAFWARQRSADVAAALLARAALPACATSHCRAANNFRAASLRAPRRSLAPAVTTPAAQLSRSTCVLPHPCSCLRTTGEHPHMPWCISVLTWCAHRPICLLKQNLVRVGGRC